MQRLKPLKVPWQVSPSTPFLKLVAAEVDDEYPTQIIFAANFGLRAKEIQQQDVGFTHAVRTTNPHLESGERSNKESATFSLVRMDFRGGLWARMSPAFSDREVLSQREFDTSLIPYSTRPGNLEVWLQDFQSFWLKSGNCPDPGAYTVESSAWVESLKLTGFEHFVIQGRDAYIEVLAREWKWNEIQKLPESW
jgi:hypothetical protein